MRTRIVPLNAREFKQTMALSDCHPVASQAVRSKRAWLVRDAWPKLAPFNVKDDAPVLGVFMRLVSVVVGWMGTGAGRGMPGVTLSTPKSKSGRNLGMSNETLVDTELVGCPEVKTTRRDPRIPCAIWQRTEV